MNRYDAVLVGAGIMSATLAVLLHELDPHMRILIVERLSTPGRESSAAENNAGTGHAANCELNYTPINKDGSLEIKKALEINSAFDLSLEFWASLASKGRLDPGSFLNQLPHISFVWGDQDVEYLQKRFQELKACNAFKDMEFSSDRNELKEWIPLVIKGRDLDQKIAATRIRRGTDIDFGALTKAYLDPLTLDGFVDLRTNTEVIDLYRNKNSLWNLQLKNKDLSYEVESEFVFLGSGGGALPLLQKSGIPESLLYGGFPVSGQWLVCSSKELVDMHHAKVYGKAPLGSPPMSVPHLDTRWIGGQRSLLFGPFAGFSTKFLKEGSYLDLFKSIKTSNIVPIINVGTQNIDLINYLLRQLLLTGKDRLKELKAFFPEAKIRDWSLSIAGQRVQIIKNTPKGGILQMGTEVVTSTDGSLAALLGASPGASTAVKAMLKVLDKCWPEKMKAGGEWRRQIQEILPSICADYSENSKVIDELRKRSNSFLGLS